jgi:hypothetical protein
MPRENSKAGNLSVLFVGVGGLIWIAPLYYWGRLPVLLSVFAPTLSGSRETHSKNFGTAGHNFSEPSWSWDPASSTTLLPTTSFVP